MPTIDDIIAREGSFGESTVSRAEASPFREGATVMEDLTASAKERDMQRVSDEKAGLQEDKGFFQLAGMAAKNRNSVGNIFRALQNSKFSSDNPPEEGFDRWGYMDSLGISEQQQLTTFHGMESKAVIDRTLKHVAIRQERDEVIEAHGVPGWFAAMGSEFIEPSNYIFAARGATAVGKIGVKGAAVRTAAEGAASELTIQAAIMSAQPEKTTEQAFVEIAASTVGAGLLGAGGAAVAKHLGKSSDDIAKAVYGTVNGQDGVVPSSKGRLLATVDAQQAQAAGAATPDSLKYQVNPDGVGVELAGGKVFKSVVGKAGAASPFIRGITSKNAGMRKAVSDLVDSNFARKAGEVDENGNFLGVATSAEIDAIKMVEELEAKTLEGVNSLYKEYAGVGQGKIAGAVDALTLGQVRRSGTKLNSFDFDRLVAQATRRGDRADMLTGPKGRQLTQEDVDYINKTAETYRRELFEPVKNSLIEQDLLPPDVTPEFAESYFSRVYDIPLIRSKTDKWRESLAPWARRTFEARRQEISDELSDAVRKSKSKSAKELGKKVEDLELEVRSLNKTSDKYRRASARLEKQRTKLFKVLDLEDELNLFYQVDYFDEFSKELVDQVTDHITTGGSVFESFEPKTRGPMKAIVLTAEDLEIEDFLVDDVKDVASRFLRISSGEYALKKKFGTTKAEDIIGSVGGDSPKGVKYNLRKEKQRTIDENLVEWDEKIAKAASPEEKAKLQKAKEKDANKLAKDLEREINDFQQMWELVRGTYRASRLDPDSGLKRGVVATKMMAMTAFLGNVVMSSIADVAMPVFTHGLSAVVRDGYVPMVKKLMDPKFRAALLKNKQDLKDAGLISQHLTNTRFVQMAMMDEANVAGKTFIERGIEKLSGNFGTLTGMNGWNDFGQELSGMLTQQRLYRLASGKKKLGKKDAQWLSEMGIGSEELRRIGASLDEHSFEEGGLLVGNLSEWADQDIAKVVSDGFFRDNRGVILQRGIGDVPILMNTDLGKVMGQFMTHAAVSNNRIFLSSLQGADKNVVSGLTALVSMGTLTYYLQELAAGREPSDDWRVWLAEGVDRSAVASLGMMVNDGALEPFGVGLSNLVGDEDYKKYERAGDPQIGLGAINGYFGNVIKGLKAAKDITLTGEASKGDIRGGMGAIPLRTIPYLRWGFDQVNEHLEEEYGR